jgi:hypothetical protein
LRYSFTFHDLECFAVDSVSMSEMTPEMIAGRENRRGGIFEALHKFVFVMTLFGITALINVVLFGLFWLALGILG